MNCFLTSNDWHWRFLRTVVQGVLGVMVANVDLLMGVAVLDPTQRALCMAMINPERSVSERAEYKRQFPKQHILPAVLVTIVLNCFEVLYGLQLAAS